MSNHIRLYFYQDVSLSIVNTNHAANHRWNDNHVAKVRLDWLRLSTRGSPFLSSNKLFHKLVADTVAREATAGTRVHESMKLGIGEVDKLMNLVSAVEKPLEWSPLLYFGGHFDN